MKTNSSGNRIFIFTHHLFLNPKLPFIYFYTPNYPSHLFHIFTFGMKKKLLCMESDTCPVLESWKEKCYKLRMEAQVNGDSNSNYPKIAKFFVA